MHVRTLRGRVEHHPSSRCSPRVCNDVAGWSVSHRFSEGDERTFCGGRAPRSGNQVPVREVEQNPAITLGSLTRSRMSTRVNASSPCNDMAVSRSSSDASMLVNVPRNSDSALMDMSCVKSVFMGVGTSLSVGATLSVGASLSWPGGRSRRRNAMTPRSLDDMVQWSS